MTARRVYIATDVPHRRARQLLADVWTALCVVGRVLGVLALAPLELAAAALGLPPVAWTIRQARTPDPVCESAAEPEPVELIGVVIPKESK